MSTAKSTIRIEDAILDAEMQWRQHIQTHVGPYNWCACHFIVTAGSLSFKVGSETSASLGCHSWRGKLASGYSARCTILTHQHPHWMLMIPFSSRSIMCERVHASRTSYHDVKRFPQGGSKGTFHHFAWNIIALRFVPHDVLGTKWVLRACDDT